MHFDSMVLLNMEYWNRFDYVMQLDTDLYFEKLMPFDLFERARDQNGAYVYHECTLEGAVDCVEGLPEALGRFIRKHRNHPKTSSRYQPTNSLCRKFRYFSRCQIGETLFYVDSLRI